MSIASRIQEIETHIGDVYDTINYSYDTTGINKNIINIPKYLKKGYIDIINNGIDTLYNNFPKVSGIGSNLSLTPTYEAPMKLNEIQGDTLQDGTPTPDTPVEIQSVTGLQNINVCGKNLIYNKNQQQSREESGIQYTFNEDGTIDVSGTATGNYNMYLMSGDSQLILPAGTYTLSGGINSYAWVRLQSGTTYIDTSSSQPSKTFTITETTNFNVVLRIRNGESVDGVFKPQLEQGSATDYEPYNGNTYEVNLGKNLFDINGNFSGNLIKYNNGFQLIKNSTNRTTNYLPSSPISKGTYTLSYDIVNSTLSDISKLIIQFINASNTKILTKELSSTGSLNCILTDDVTKIYFYISNTETADTQITLDSIQLEKGSQATSYSPYFTPIELNKIGTYQDSIKKSTGKNIITTYNYASSGYINYNYDNSKIGKTMTYSFIPNFSTTNATLYIRANTSISAYKIGTISTITSGTKVSVTFTLTDEQYNTIKNTTGGYIQVYKSGVSMDENSIINPMLEENSQATDYEPYGKVWYIEKQIGKVVLDGSETYSQIDNSSYSDTILRFATNITDKKPNTGDTIKDNILSDKFTCKILNDNSTRQTNSISGQNILARINLFIDKNIIGGTDTNALTTWLSTHNTEVLYVLATPTYTEITNTELIEDLETLYTAKSQEGTTNISITSEDLEMILNVSALKGDA